MNLNLSLKNKPLLLLMVTFIIIIKINAQQVWPADANNNGIVNNIDFIFTGVAIQHGGPDRLLIDQGIEWNPKTATDWINSFDEIGVNYKHADANGNGWIDGADLFSVNYYYDTTNIHFTNKMGNTTLGDDLYFTFSETEVEGEETITIGINLGTASNPINNLHGIAFSIGFDTSKIKELETTIDFHAGWLGTPDDDLYTLMKYEESINIERADFSATRGGFGSVSGSGEIGSITIILEDDLAGKRSDIIGAIKFNFENVLGIDSLADDMQITSKNDSINISDGIINEILVKKTKSKVHLFPNPVKNKLFIKSDIDLTNVELISITGKQISIEIINNTINLNHIDKGIYYLKFRNEQIIETHIVVKE